MQRNEITGPMAFFLEKCKHHRLKVTPQRVAIFRELAGSKAHPSAEKMYRIVKKRFPNISFDTVNRTLLTFAEIGVLDVVEGYGNPRRFDPNLDEHHHLHCIRCGDIIDFYCRDCDELRIPPAEKRGFRVLGKKVVVKGICKKCGQKQ